MSKDDFYQSLVEITNILSKLELPEKTLICGIITVATLNDHNTDNISEFYDLIHSLGTKCIKSIREESLIRSN